MSFFQPVPTDAQTIEPWLETSVVWNDCDDILRAVNSYHVMKGFGHIFSQNVRFHATTATRRNTQSAMETTPSTQSAMEATPSTATIGLGISEEEAHNMYSLTFVTDTIQRFLSHSWGASHILKWGALADLFHRKIAIVSANGYFVVASVFGVLYRATFGEHIPAMVCYALYEVIPSMIIITVFVYGHKVVSGCACFLDKFCIHQSDGNRKMAGVKALGKFVDMTENLTALWSPDYFERLWCIFEVACFGSKHGAMAMEFQPLWLSPFLYGMLLTQLIVFLVHSVLFQTGWYYLFILNLGGSLFGDIGRIWLVYPLHMTLLNIVPGTIICILVRMMMVNRRTMEEWVAAFTLDKAKVTEEHDRELVYRKIQDLFGSTNNFEAFVRNDLRKALDNALGKEWKVPYTWGLFIFQPYLWMCSGDSLSSTDAELTESGLMAWCLYPIELTQILYYGGLNLVLPLALQAVGVTTMFTMRLPFLLGLLINTFVYLGVTFVIITAFWLLSYWFMISV